MRGERWELRQLPHRKIQVVFYVPGEGDKKHELSTGTKDPREAEIRAAEIWAKAMRRAGKEIPEDAQALARVHVADAVAEFIEQLERETAAHREQYLPRYKADLNLYVTPKDDDEVEAAERENRVIWQPLWTYVDEITSARWDEEKLRLHKSNGGPLGWNSIRHLANTLRHLLRFSVGRGYLENEPVLKAPANKLIRSEKRKRRALEPSERESLLRWLYKYTPKVTRKGRQRTHAPGTAGRFYELMHFSLLRRGEAWALTLRWIDRRAKILKVPAEHSKSGEEEAVALHERAELAILEQAKAQGLDPKKDRDVPVFGEINVRPAFEWAMDKAKLDWHGITPHHTARHTGGTILAKKTRSREQLKKAGRWRSDQSVDSYIHVDAEDARDLIEKL